MTNPQLPYLKTLYLPDMDSAFRVYQTHIRTTKPIFSRPWHDHPMFEINVVLEGKQNVCIGDVIHEMQKGDVILIPPGLTHRLSDTAGTELTYFALHFDVEDYRLRAILSRFRCGFHPYGSPIETEIRPALMQLIQTFRASEHVDMKHPAHRMRFTSQLFGLFAALGSVEDPGGLAAGADPTKYAVAHRMAEQFEAIASAGDSAGTMLGISIARLAEQLGYSSAHCCRLFRSVYGVSPRQYLSGVTLHRARLELLNPRQSLEQVASKLGYQDGAHFSKQFKRWTGCSPSEYRRRQMQTDAGG
ncbi:helix-turn-helix domain-containing protein [Paenibacillus sp. HJGM_3]|uniref:helix-turn-helix domain-containing protein n=1 Tax=Paenibacillus sp. HJGM_3 TaxID=3379816 RepID=UPI00385FD463